MDRERFFREVSSEPDSALQWHISFMDILFLTLVFVTLLTAIYRNDSAALMALPADVRNELLKKFGRPIPIDGLYGNLSSALSADINDGDVVIRKNGNEIKITFPASGLYGPGSAEILDTGRELVAIVGAELSAIDMNFAAIDIEGHTDPAPISSERFATNWELSAARAAMVLRLLVENGADPARLQASAYADTRPILPVRDSTGQPLLRNYAANRRIEIRVFFRGSATN